LPRLHHPGHFCGLLVRRARTWGPEHGGSYRLKLLNITD